MFIIRKIYYFLLDTIQTILIVASVLMILYAFVIQPNEVSGLSMYPTFKDHDYLLSYLLDVKFDKYKKAMWWSFIRLSNLTSYILSGSLQRPVIRSWCKTARFFSMVHNLMRVCI